MSYSSVFFSVLRAGPGRSPQVLKFLNSKLIFVIECVTLDVT